MSDRERVEALAEVSRAEVDRVLALFPMDEHGTGHIADCGFDANDERCDCYTLPERIAGVLRDLLAEAKADAWDEAWATGMGDSAGLTNGTQTDVTANPYRETTTGGRDE